MKKTLPLMMLATMAFAPAAFSAPAGTLSVHVLDQQTGMPPADVAVTLEKQEQDMAPGVYKVTFKTADYFHGKKLDSFFPEVPVLFTVTRTNEKLHIPLLLSQYGYSTYKGS